MPHDLSNFCACVTRDDKYLIILFGKDIDADYQFQSIYYLQLNEMIFTTDYKHYGKQALWKKSVIGRPHPIGAPKEALKDSDFWIYSNFESVCIEHIEPIYMNSKQDYLVTGYAHEFSKNNNLCIPSDMISVIKLYFRNIREYIHLLHHVGEDYYHGTYSNHYRIPVSQLLLTRYRVRNSKTRNKATL